MDLGQLQVAGTAAGSGIRLAAGGHIAGNGDDVIHIAGGAQAVAELEAGTGIGTPAQPLRVSIGTLDGHSVAGDIHCYQSQAVGIGVRFHLEDVRHRDQVPGVALAEDALDLGAASVSRSASSRGDRLRATSVPPSVSSPARAPRSRRCSSAGSSS